MNATLSKWFYQTAYRFSTPNWDNEQVPPQLARVIASSRVPGRALDLGCGTGTQSLYLAQHGWSVVGIDLAPQAIERARQKARQAGAKVDFQIADVTRLDFLHDPFDLVVDVGCFHGLDAPGRDRYAQNLAQLTRTGSLFLLYAFDQHGSFGVGVNRAEITRWFAPHFSLSRIETGTYLGGRASRCYSLHRQ